MIKTKLYLAALVLGAAVPGAFGQPAFNVRVVDMAKLYDGHYKTIEQGAKFEADQQKAQTEIDRMSKEGNALVEQYKAFAEQANNPALSPEAKSKSQGDAEKKMEEIQKKQQEVQTFAQNTQNSLQQRLQTFRAMLIEEIAKVATDVAKRRGATFLVDKAGPSMFGISNLVYSDPAYEITDEVAAEINKSKPADAPAAPAAATGAAAPAPGSPTITVPGLQKK
jgi:outer membrane protein